VVSSSTIWFILDKNILKVDPMDIRDIKVVETIKEGNTIYKA
jgi:predicted amidohydrolase YtcJ